LGTLNSTVPVAAPASLTSSWLSLTRVTCRGVAPPTSKPVCKLATLSKPRPRTI
jgi:hypothetical protein